ncbi:MAG: DUF4105 domain-containing protein [Paludibacteraceae bacterium]|nr:DUF4105 domain-containing protein [Paludibacteraceae bacterium]
MRNKLIILLTLLLYSSTPQLLAQRQLSEDAQISILTCSPGKALYERFGHTAIRVKDPAAGLDVVFNYGCFSFENEHFYYKFVKGETYYMLGVEDARSFFMTYYAENRFVYEQELNLTFSQQQELFDKLIINSQPENRTYLYNFVFDNCATRPYDLIKEVIGDTIISDYEGYTGQSFRRFIRTYTGAGSWEAFGINMIFGNRADQAMSSEQRLFLPEELMLYLSQAKTTNGISVVRSQFIAPFSANAVPWYKMALFGILFFAAIMIFINIWDWHRNKWSWGVDLALGIVYVLLFAIVIFLTYFSIHPLVGWNWRLFLFPLIHLCSRLIYILR